MTAPAPRSAHHASHRQSRDDSSEPGENKTVHTPPNELNTRAAKRSAQADEKVDLQFGTPVPGKQGFVTSPYAPDSGYIDVRGMPPRTQVKDPYTGKTFLTP